jgi:hypothetical protein
MMSRNVQKVGFLHYSAPPVVGGVENVILAHVRLFSEAGYPITVVAGRGNRDALPPGVGLVHIPELDSQHPQILEMSHELDQGTIPPDFEHMVIWFSPEADPDQVASLILKWMKHRSFLRLRRHIRRDLTWHGIFQREILPLLDRGAL